MAKDSGTSNFDKQFNQFVKKLDTQQPSAVFKETGSSVRDDCESLHRKCPGIFWDTLNMDNPEKAYAKLKSIVKDIVKSQNKLKPMFDVDFRGSDIPVVKGQRDAFLKEIAPTRLFY